MRLLLREAQGLVVPCPPPRPRFIGVRTMRFCDFRIRMFSLTRSTQTQLTPSLSYSLTHLAQVLDRVMFELDHTVQSIGETKAEMKIVVPESAGGRIRGPNDEGLRAIAGTGCAVRLDDRCET